MALACLELSTFKHSEQQNFIAGKLKTSSCYFVHEGYSGFPVFHPSVLKIHLNDLILTISIV